MTIKNKKINGVPGKIVLAEIERIEQRDGYIKPEIFVNESRDPKSPTHACFMWDDTNAANEYRKQQARHIISRIRVIILAGPDNKDVTVQAKVNVINADGVQGYRSILAVMEDPDERSYLMKAALSVLQTFLARFEAFEALTPLMRDVRHIYDKYAIKEQPRA